MVGSGFGKYYRLMIVLCTLATLSSWIYPIQDCQAEKRSNNNAHSVKLKSTKHKIKQPRDRDKNGTNPALQTPLIAYQSITAQGYSELRLADCANSSCSKRSIRTLSQAGSAGAGVKMLNNLGRPVLLDIRGLSNQLWLTLCADQRCTGATASRQIYASAGSIRSANFLFGDDSLPLIVLGEQLGENSAVRAIHCHDRVCNQSDIYTVTDEGDAGYQVEIAKKPNQLPYILSHDEAAQNTELKLYRCLTPSCSSSEFVKLITRHGFVISLEAGSIKLILKPNGLPFISVYAGTYAQNGTNIESWSCQDLNCTEDNHQGLDSNANVGRYIDAVIGTDGFPIISYQSVQLLAGGAYKLTTIKCLDDACQDRTKVVHQSSEGPLWGYFNSMQQGSSGFPLIATQNRGDQQGSFTLELARCLNADCTQMSSETIDDTPGFNAMHISMMLANQEEKP